MKRFNKVSSLILGAALLSALAYAVADTFSLARVAKVGDAATYKFTAKLDFSGVNIEITGKTDDKVLSVGQDGVIEYESVQSGLVVKTPDGEQEIDEEQKTKMTIGSDRVVVKYGDEGDEDASSLRLALLGTVLKPGKDVAIGEKWSGTIKHTHKETYPVTANYEVVGTERIGAWDTVKIKISTKETEGDEKASAEGHVWIIIADGLSAKEELTIKNAPFAMSPTPIDMTISVERTK